MKNKLVTRADIILLIVLLVFGFGSPFLIGKKEVKNGVVVIKKDGEVFSQLNLSENQTILIEDGEDYNLVEIKDKEVYVKSASCKNHDCINMGKIKREGELIACLPNRVIIMIKSNDIDVVLK